MCETAVKQSPLQNSGSDFCGLAIRYPDVFTESTMFEEEVTSNAQTFGAEATDESEATQLPWNEYVKQ